MTHGGNILRMLAGLLPLILGLVLWQIFVGSSAALPPPSTWWNAVVLLASSGSLWPAVVSTLSMLLQSFVLSSCVGFALGLLIGTIPSLRQWLALLLEYFRALPPPVLIPVAVLMLGYTDIMKILVIGFAAFWPVLLNTIAGVGRIEPLTFDVAASFRLSWIDTMLKIVIPATIPSLLLGLRTALPQTIVLTLVVEIFTDSTGLGGLMIDAERNFNAAAVLGLLVFVGALGFCLSSLFNVAERFVLKTWPMREN